MATTTSSDGSEQECDPGAVAQSPPLELRGQRIGRRIELGVGQLALVVADGQCGRPCAVPAAGRGHARVRRRRRNRGRSRSTPPGAADAPRRGGQAARSPAGELRPPPRGASEKMSCDLLGLPLDEESAASSRRPAIPSRVLDQLQREVGRTCRPIRRTASPVTPTPAGAMACRKWKVDSRGCDRSLVLARQSGSGIEGNGSRGANPVPGLQHPGRRRPWQTTAAPGAAAARRRDRPGRSAPPVDGSVPRRRRPASSPGCSDAGGPGTRRDTPPGAEHPSRGPRSRGGRPRRPGCRRRGSTRVRCGRAVAGDGWEGRECWRPPAVPCGKRLRRHLSRCASRHTTPAAKERAARLRGTCGPLSRGGKAVAVHSIAGVRNSDPPRAPFPRAVSGRGPRGPRRPAWRARSPRGR